MARIVAVSTSEKKGMKKTPQARIVLKEGLGVEGDAHADDRTHRQVSLLATESIDKMKAKGFELAPGDFAENITTEGIDLCSMPIGARMRVGKEVVLEMTQIGKECHADCAIRKEVGDCIMPREGVFTRVIRGGTVKPGDEIKIISKNQDAEQNT
jgi:molybdopterin adenylyltransferase